MRITAKMIISACFVFLLSVDSWAATIVSPKEDEQVDAGSWITVTVKPEPGEDWQGFIIEFKTLEYDAVNKVYKTTIQVPNDALGFRNDLRVIGVDSARNKVELTRRVFVKLPSNVVLQGIRVGEELMVLYIAPPDSSLEDRQRIETDEVSVAGIYSDGISRLITPSAMGTTYVSSDEKVVTVDSEGKLAAKALGRSKIAVRNGKYSAAVRVVVKPY